MILGCWSRDAAAGAGLDEVDDLHDIRTEFLGLASIGSHATEFAAMKAGVGQQVAKANAILQQ